MAEPVCLIGDIGGTNARFALAPAAEQRYRDERILECADHSSPESAIEAYLAEVKAPNPEVICLAVAGPVVAGGAEFTNNDWRLQEQSLAARFGCAGARILNDFEAVALGLPTLAKTEQARIGAQPLPDLSGAHFTLGVIGPGTGLGAAGLLRREGRTLPLVSEAGHVGFAPENARQCAVRDVLQKRFGRISNERLISGGGLENIFAALAEIHGEPAAGWPAARIFEQADADRLAGEAVQLFFEVLGQVSGDLALALGAHDGIYIAGGIVQRYQERLSGSGFRAGFENKGRHRRLLENTPTVLIRHPHPGLAGAMAAAQRLLS